MMYLNRMNPKVVCEEDKTIDGVVCTISHTKPLTTTAELYADGGTTLSGRSMRIMYLASSENATGFHLHIKLELTDIRNTLRCKLLISDPDYFNWQCPMIVFYYNRPQNRSIKNFTFRLTVRLPIRVGLEIKVFANKITEYECDCTVDLTLTIRAKIFRADCITEMFSGESFTYGEELCFAIFGNDPIASSSEYEIGSLFALNRRSEHSNEMFDILALSIARCSLTNNCAKGLLFITIPMIFVGKSKFSAIVLLKDLKRVLSEDDEVKPKGGRVNIPGEFEVSEVYGTFIDDIPDNDDMSFGYSLAVSMSILIGLLIMII